MQSKVKNKMAVASPKARSTEKKTVGRVHETGRIPFFLFRVTIAGTVAGLARRAVGYRPPRAFPGPPGAPPEPPRGA